MHQGKHRKRSRRKSGTSMTLLVSLLVLVCVVVGGTVAFLMDKTIVIDNIFTPSTITTSVEENLSGAVKSNVTIKNNGNTEAYIRADVIITWQDENGNVYGQTPVQGTDYTLTYAAAGWTQATDGFWYYTSPVASGASTGVLISECSQIKELTVGDGDTTYYLTVEIISSGIQSVPTTVVTSEWKSGVSGVDDNGNLTIKTTAPEQGGEGA